MGFLEHLKSRTSVWGATLLFGWSSVGCEPVPVDPLPSEPRLLWTFGPSAAAEGGGGLGPWRWNDCVIFSLADTLWQLHASTGTVTQKTALPSTWSSTFFPGETSLLQGDWAYALDASGLLAVHLPTLNWSILPWPRPPVQAPGTSEIGIEPALFAGPDNAVGLITKHKPVDQSPWTSTAWLWTPSNGPNLTFAEVPWKAIWTQGWREPAVGFADGLAWSRRENSRRDGPAGIAVWWRHRAPQGGSLVHSNGARMALSGNPTAHPPLALSGDMALVVLEYGVTAYHSKGTSIWNTAYGPPGHPDQHLWLGWTVAVPRPTGGATESDASPVLWIKGSDDGLLALDCRGNALRRWNRAGWSPSGKPIVDSTGGMWYCAEGGLWRAFTDPSTPEAPLKIADANFQCTPAVWTMGNGTLAVARNGMKISAYLCPQP